jgi:hypothetical protein
LSIGIAPGDLRGRKRRIQPISPGAGPPAGAPAYLLELLAVNAAICCVM